MINKIVVASDHAGYELKEKLILRLNVDFKSLESPGFETIDLGTNSLEKVDYPDYAKSVCEKIISSKDPKSLGLLICGSGQGMVMAANKFKNIRAALCWSPSVARLARQHNNANILCLSSREIDDELNYKILKAFLTSTFEGGRHQLRIDKI